MSMTLAPHTFEHIVAGVYGDRVRRHFLIDVPDLLASRGLANTRGHRAFFARVALKELHQEFPGRLIIARMAGVRRQGGGIS